MEGTQKSICVIACYFGKFPVYFELWLQSCSYNPTVDFLIYTDCNYEKELPFNVSVKQTTLMEIKKRAEETVGFPVSLEKAYRLCDFKPLYGAIFKTDLEKYDFWGFCDLDIMIGNIRKFITDDILEKYDKINRWGHLSFQRNTEECNRRYKLDAARYGYQEVLTSTRDFGFDEYDYISIYEKYGLPIWILPMDSYADIRARHKRFCVKGNDNYKEQIFYWENGAVYREYLDGNDQLKKNEYLYIHFKQRGALPVHFKENTDEVNSFYITNTGFYEKKDKVTKEIIQKYNPYPGKNYEKYEDIKYRLKYDIRKFKRKYFD